MNLYECFDDVIINGSNVIVVAHEDVDADKEEVEEVVNKLVDNVVDTNIGGSPTKSISENISELYSKMTYAEEKYASNLWSEDEDALFIEFLERKKELYEYYKN